MPKLTKRVVDGLEPPDQRDDILWDSQLPGFGLRIKPSGRRTYILQYRNPQGRSRRFTIGLHGPFTPDQARQEAKLLLADVARGLDPAESRKQDRDTLSLADLADRYMTEHAEPKKKPKSVKEDRRLWDQYVLPALGKRNVKDITRADVAKLHSSVGKKTPTTANRVLALLSKAFNLAEVWGIRPDGSNPCRHVKRFKERRVERFLSSEELARLGAVLTETERDQTEMPSVVLAIRLLALTGCRLGEILSLRWEHVDLRRGLLLLPDSKTGKKTVPLGAAAIEILTEAPRESENPYVVIGRRPGRPLVNLQLPWRRIREKAGLSDVRLHDLRHSFASVGASGGMGLPIIGALLGHSEPQTTQRYAHLSASPLKEAADRISSEIASGLRGELSG